jgi:CelD/BcsL family acetyltransferase involved in cellulose biosynthesis
VQHGLEALWWGAAAAPGRARSGGLRIGTVRDEDEFSASDSRLAEVHWPSLEAEPAVVRTLAEARGSEFKPFALLVQDDSGIRAAAMMRVDEIELPVRLGHRLAYRPRCSALVAEPGVIGADDPQAAAALVQGIRAGMRGEHVDAAFIPSVRVGSALARAASAVPWFLRSHFERPALRWRASIPPTRDEFMSALSGHTRSNLRRLERRFHERVPNWSVRRYQRPEDLDAAISEIERVASRTWQRKLGGGFEATAVEVAFYRLAASRDAFRAWVLYDDSKPIAFLNGLVDHDVFVGRFMAYDPDYAPLGPGLYLFSQLIGDICSDDRVHYYDLGPGDSDFKRRFGDQSWLEADVYLARATPKGLRLNLTRSGTKALQYAGKSAVTHNHTAARIWTQRRKQIATTTNPPPRLPWPRTSP